VIAAGIAFAGAAVALALVRTDARQGASAGSVRTAPRGVDVAVAERTGDA
jgi:hypothetical protein